MSQNKGIAFIIGGGPRIGYSVAEAFTRRGCKVAIASRRPDKKLIESRGWLAIEMDLADHDAIKKGFETVRAQLGPPNVVVYNAAALTFTAEDDPFSLNGGQYLDTLHVNVIGAYVCLCETMSGFTAIDDSGEKVAKVFIATGNVVPFQPIPFAVTLGSGKAALVNLVQVGNVAYAKKGYRFYFASQILQDGGPVPYENVDGPAHGRVYTELVDRPALGEWDVRFAD